LTNPPAKERVLMRASKRFVLGLQTHNAFEAAAAIAFWFFLSLMPLLVLLGFLVAQVARTRGIDALLAPLFEIVPETAEDILRKELDRMAGSTATLAPLGVVGFLWTASSGLHNLMDVFETGVRVERRAWWKQRLMAIGWVLAGLMTACLLAWLLVRVDGALHPRDATGPATVSTSSLATSSPPPALSGAPSPPSRTQVDRMATPRETVSRARGAFNHRFTKAIHTPLEQAIATALMLGLGMALLAGFYRFAVVHPPGVRRRVWPGTVTAVVSWLVVSWLFGLYAVSMSSYAVYYGSLAAVAVMLVWLYITSLALVVGAEVNAQLEGVRDRPLPA
jgi:membrane protein